MTRYKFFERVAEQIAYEMAEAKTMDYYGVAEVQIETPAGWIDVVADHWSTRVEVVHKDNDRRSHNIEHAIAIELPAWDSIETEPEMDIFERNGFASETDYNTWKYC